MKDNEVLALIKNSKSYYEANRVMWAFAATINNQEQWDKFLTVAMQVLCKYHGKEMGTV